MPSIFHIPIQHLIASGICFNEFFFNDFDGIFTGPTLKNNNKTQIHIRVNSLFHLRIFNILNIRNHYYRKHPGKHTVADFVFWSVINVE